MAKKKAETKNVLERVYNVPLRKEYLKVPRYKRTNKAVIALRQFILKHMKATEVKLGKWLNLEMWKHGIKNPPHHIKVKAVKDDKGIVKVELEKLPKQAIIEQKKAEEKLQKKEKKEAVKAKNTETKPESKKDSKENETSELEKELEDKAAEKKEEKKEKAKKIEKEEIKEIKKEKPKTVPKPAEKSKEVKPVANAPKQR